MILAYAPVFRAGFVWDDVDHVAANPRLERWSSALEYFARPEGRYYRPLVFLSYAADTHLWGRSAAGYHATNLGLHLLNALLLAAAARRCGLRPPVALAAALLFAVHPIQTEAVAYVSGRTDLLMTAGALIAATALLGGAPARRRGVLAGLATAAAILAKESGYALALLVPWLAWRRAGGVRERLWLGLPAVLAGAALLALRPGGIPELSEARATWASFCGAGRAIIGYASLLVWPATLMVDRITPLPATAGGLAVGATALLALSTLIALGLKRRGAVADWTLWATAFYLPVANLVPLYPSIAARALFTPEHDLYPSLAGVAVLAALAADRALSRTRVSTVLSLAGAALILALAARTAWRAADWRDEARLFGSAVAAGSLSPRVHYDFGNALLERGDLTGAARAFESAIQLAPQDGQAWANLGVVRHRQGDLDGALAAEERAAALLPEDPLVRENLGGLHLARGEIDAARAAFSASLRLDPRRERARQALRALEAAGHGAPPIE